MSRKMGLFGVVFLVALCSSLIFAQLAFATVDYTDGGAVGGESTAPQTDSTAGGGAGTTTTVAVGEKCGNAHDRNDDGMMDTWDRNMDGDMDAFDVDFDGDIDRQDSSISCTQTATASRLPLTGAPALAIAAVAAAMMGTGYVLRRSRS